MKLLETSSMENIQGGCGNPCGCGCNSIFASIAVALAATLGGCGCSGVAVSVALGAVVSL